MSRTLAQVSSDIRMAGARLPGRKDEAIWNKAKAATRKAYPDLSEDNDRFWEITQTIYSSMGGT